VVEHATDHPGANVILAHAGISDLAWIWRRAAERPNVYFDTSWWNPADLITLYSLVPPSQILYGSDAPYGRPLMSVTLAVRCGLQAGLTVEQMQGVMGGQLARLLDGEAPLDLGSPNGNGTAEVDLLLERVASCLVFSIGPAFGGVPPLVAEGLALARLACEVGDEAPQAEACQAVLDLLDQFDEMGGAETARRGTIQLGLIILALCVARTGNVPLPQLGDGKMDVSERVG
jgi:hypothetical protein